MFTANIQIKVVRDKSRGTVLLKVTSNCYWKAEISIFPFQLINCKFMIEYFWTSLIFHSCPFSTDENEVVITYMTWDQNVYAQREFYIFILFYLSERTAKSV